MQTPLANATLPSNCICFFLFVLCVSQMLVEKDLKTKGINRNVIHKKKHNQEEICKSYEDAGCVYNTAFRLYILCPILILCLTDARGERPKDERDRPERDTHTKTQPGRNL